MDTTINLTDCSYPIHIKKDLDTLEGLSYLGQLKSKIKVDLKLETCKCNDAPKNMLWRIHFKH